MPVYEYKCESCGHKNGFLEPVGGAKKSFFASILGIGARKCEKCGGKKLERIISSISVHRTQTQAEVMDDLRKIAPVQFVPDMRPKISPENCPNCHGQPPQSSSAHNSTKQNRVVLD